VSRVPPFRSFLCAIAAAAAACLAAGCGRAPDGAGEGSAALRATASLPPVAGLVRALGGERWQVSSLVGPGQDPHVYEPTPGQVSALASSRLFFRTEMPFEEALAARAASAFPGVGLVALEPAVPHEVGRGDVHEHGRDHGHEHGHDHDEAAVHGWLSPANLEAWTRAIAAELSAADPAEAGAVGSRLSAWLGELAAETSRTRAAVSDAGVRAFAAWHPAYGAWAEAFGLEQIALEADGKAPGPRTIAAARERVAATGARTMLVQNGAEAARAAAFARDAGLRIVVVAPLGDDPLETLRALREAVFGAAPDVGP